MANTKKSRSDRNRLADLQEPGGYLDHVESQPKNRNRDRHKASVTVAARVSPDLAGWVKEQAAAEGITVNAWLTKILKQIKSGLPPP